MSQLSKHLRPINTELKKKVLAQDEPAPPVLGYTLEPIYETPKGYITTHAFILCSSCDSAISGSGGPKYNALCLNCVDKLAVFNKLKS